MGICGVGDNVVDYYRDLGLMFPGGNPVNVAVFARRSGMPSAYLGVVGDDSAGRLVLEALHDEGVETPRVRTTRGPNAMSVIGLDESGNRSFLKGGRPAPAPLALDDADLDYLGGFQMVHIGEWGDLEPQLPVVSRHCIVSFDFGAKPMSYVEPLAPWVTIAELSLPEAGESEAVTRARDINRLGPRTVLVTRGAAGATLLDEAAGSITHVGTEQGPIADTNGAGDAFIGTLLAHLLDGGSPEQAMQVAARVAGETCRHLGVFGPGRPVPAGAGV